MQTNSKGVPKWEPRARLGIYLGRSPSHASNVALVLNPRTGLVSPQFHVVFDDDFTTVPHLRKGTMPPNWAQLVEGSREKVTEEFYDISKTWFDPASDETADEIIHPDTSANEGDPVPPIPSVNEGDTQPPTVTQDSEGATVHTDSQASEGDIDPNDLLMPDMINLETAGHRRSPRIASQPPKKYNFCSIAAKFCALGVLMAATISSPVQVFSHGQACVNSVVHKCNVVNANFDGTYNEIHHMVMAAGGADNESYTFREMLQQDDAASFIEAMKKETNAHESRGHWEVIKRSSIPYGTKTIQAIWSFKRKRFPDGLINKYKA